MEPRIRSYVLVGLAAVCLLLVFTGIIPFSLEEAGFVERAGDEQLQRTGDGFTSGRSLATTATPRTRTNPTAILILIAAGLLGGLGIFLLLRGDPTPRPDPVPPPRDGPDDLESP